MSSYHQIIYQVVFSTKSHTPVLDDKIRSELYKYFSGVLSKHNCKNYIINGVEDHTHFVFSLHPTIALANLVKSLKHAGTYFLKEINELPSFSGWQSGYGAFTYSPDALSNLIRYVKNQEEHHRKVSFREEYK